MAVVPSNVSFDCSDQFGNAAKHTPANPIVSDVAEEAFHHIQPGRTGWGVMHMEAFVLRQPPANVGMFSGAVVVGDDMELLVGRSLPVDEAKEGNPVFVGMAIPALT